MGNIFSRKITQRDIACIKWAQETLDSMRYTIDISIMLDANKLRAIYLPDKLKNILGRVRLLNTEDIIIYCDNYDKSIDNVRKFIIQVKNLFKELIEWKNEAESNNIDSIFKNNLQKEIIEGLEKVRGILANIVSPSLS